MVGFYTICNSFPVTIAIAEKIKLLRAETIIVFGGPQATLTAYEILKMYDFVDIVALGEGEKNINDLISAILNRESLLKVQGIVFRKMTGEIECTDMPPIISGEQLKKYTVLENMENRMEKQNGIYNIEAGRGCPYGCTFCSTSVFWGKRFRIKPVKDIIEEIKYLYKKYDIRFFRLEHDLFTGNKKYVREFCEALEKEALDIQWACSARIDTLDEEMMSLLKVAKCSAIYIGLETGSSRMQKILKKYLPVENADLKLLRLREYGFDLTISFIYGFKEEREKDFFDTISLIEKLYLNNICKVQLHKFMPLPNTEETKKVEKDLRVDFGDIDISIYYKNRFGEKLNTMISHAKTIHSCFFSFENSVRQRYKHMDILVTCISLSFSQFKISAKHLVEEYGLIAIYNRYKEKIENCFKNIQQLSITQAYTSKSTNQILVQLYISMITDLGENISVDYIQQIIKYEIELYDFVRMKDVAMEEKQYCTDVYSCIKEKKILDKNIEKVPQVIRFRKDNNKVKISLVLE